MHEYNNQNNLYNIYKGVQANKKKKDDSKEIEPRSSYLKNFQQRNKAEHIQQIFNDTDNSMEKILNSSMSQLEKVIQGLEEPQRKPTVSVQELLKQNSVLKANLVKMKKILKQKLEAGLTKQRQELYRMLGDYISLITKLLQDKQQLTNRLTDREANFRQREQELMNKIQSAKESNIKLKRALEERDSEIAHAKEKTNQFMISIQQYEEEARREQVKFQQMADHIRDLEQQLAQRSCKDTVSPSFGHPHKKEHIEYDSESSLEQVHNEHLDTRTQQLIDLFENSQQECARLKETNEQLKEANAALKAHYEQKIEEIEKENEYEFIQYEKAVKETLDKKDDCIERLNLIIQNLRAKKSQS